MATAVSARGPATRPPPSARSRPVPRRQVWFLVVPGVELLDVAGPWEVFAHANEALGRTAYDLRLLSPAPRALSTRHGIGLSTVEPCPRRAARVPEVVIVAGGAPAAPLPKAEQEVAAWLARHRARLSTVVSICTGAFIVGEAGLLDDRRATTHWMFLKELGQRFPSARVAKDAIFVRDGAVWTSAGITAGIDLTLALVEEHHGHAVAMAVARRLVVFLRRPGGQAQFSAALSRQDRAPGKLGDFTRHVLEHLEEPLPVQRLARSLGMSARSLTRFCREHWQESPAALVRQVRLDEARRLLEESTLPLKAIAAHTGLGNASTLWRVFSQHLGVTPADYRARFTSGKTSRAARTRAGV